MMRPYLVCSLEYGEVVPVTDDGQGPLEYGADVVFVEAESAADARAFAVHFFRKTGAPYLDHVDNPFDGLQVILQTCSVHGGAVWAQDHYECPQCEALFEVES